MALAEKKTVKDVLFEVAIYLFFTVFTILCVFPFYFIFINSIASNAMVQKHAVFFYPLGVHLHNYLSVFKIRTLPQAAFISVARTIIGTLLSLIAATVYTQIMAYMTIDHGDGEGGRQR